MVSHKIYILIKKLIIILYLLNKNKEHGMVGFKDYCPLNETNSGQRIEN